MKGFYYALRSDRFFRRSDRLMGKELNGLFNNRAVGRKKNPSDRWFVIELPDQGFGTLMKWAVGRMTQQRLGLCGRKRMKVLVKDERFVLCASVRPLFPAVRPIDGEWAVWIV